MQLTQLLCSHISFRLKTKNAKDRYMKNSSVEWESGSHVRPGRSKIEISITRNPLNVGSVICRPFGL